MRVFWMTLKYECVRKKRGVRYKRYGQTHRINGPAIIINIGVLVWYKNGEPLRYVNDECLWNTKCSIIIRMDIRHIVVIIDIIDYTDLLVYTPPVLCIGINMATLVGDVDALRYWKMSLKYEVNRNKRRLIYKRHGRTHRIDKPAILFGSGDLYWYRCGRHLRYRHVAWLWNTQ